MVSYPKMDSKCILTTILKFSLSLQTPWEADLWGYPFDSRFLWVPVPRPRGHDSRKGQCWGWFLRDGGHSEYYGEDLMLVFLAYICGEFECWSFIITVIAMDVILLLLFFVCVIVLLFVLLLLLVCLLWLLILSVDSVIPIIDYISLLKYCYDNN